MFNSLLVQELTPSGDQPCAYDINDAGIIVGFDYWSYPVAHPYLWGADGSGGWLPVEKAWWAEAVAINNNSWVVGWYCYPDGGAPPSCGAKQGFLRVPRWGVTELGPLSSNYEPTALSDKGRIVGVDEANGRAFTWYKGVFSHLPSLVPGGSTYAAAVNNCGTIVGKAIGADGKWYAVGWSRRICD